MGLFGGSSKSSTNTLDTESQVGISDATLKDSVVQDISTVNGTTLSSTKVATSGDDGITANDSDVLAALGKSTLIKTDAGGYFSLSVGEGGVLSIGGTTSTSDLDAVISGLQGNLSDALSSLGDWYDKNKKYIKYGAIGGAAILAYLILRKRK